MKLSQQCIKEEVDMSQLLYNYIYIYIYMINNSIYNIRTTNKCAKNDI